MKYDAKYWFYHASWQSTTSAQAKIENNLIAMMLWTDIHSPQRIDPIDTGDRLTFSVVPPPSQSYLCCEISQRLPNELTFVVLSEVS